MTKPLLAKLSPVLTLGVGILSRASGQIVAFLVILFALRVMDPESFGIYAISAAFVTIIRALLYTATFQYIIRTDDIRSFSTECLVLSFSVVAVLSLASGMLLFFASDIFGASGILTTFLLLAPSNGLAAVSAWQEAQILRKEKLKSYYGITTLAEALSGLVAIGLLLSGLGMEALIIQAYARALFVAAGYRRIMAPVLSQGFSVIRTFEVLRWSMPQYLSMALGQATTFAPDMIIGALLSPAATGLFRAASRITTAVSDVCAQPLRMIAMTVFSRLAPSEKSSTEAFIRLVALSLLVGGAALGFLAINISLALHVIFGPKWAGIENLVAILCVGRFFSVVGGVSSPLLVAFNRQRALIPIQVGMSITLVLGLLFFSPYGLMASGTVTSVSLAFGGVSFVLCAMLITRPDLTKFLRFLWSAFFPIALAGASAISLIAYDSQIFATVWGSILCGGVSSIAFAIAATTQRKNIALMLQATSSKAS